MLRVDSTEEWGSALCLLCLGRLFSQHSSLELFCDSLICYVMLMISNELPMSQQYRMLFKML